MVRVLPTTLRADNQLHEDLQDMTTRPPTNQAVRRALNILLESSNSQNTTTANDDSQTALEAYDKRATAYKVLIHTTQMALNEELQNLHYQRNMLAPIHKLPPCIFTSILTFCVDEDPDVDSTRPVLLRQLASVSSHWLKTVKSTPTLWTVIEGSWDLRTVQLFLRKSHRSPLNIRQVARGGGGLFFRFFLAVILPHRARWRSVILNGPGVEALEVPAHILQTIQITKPSPRFSISLTSSKPLPAIKLQNRSFTWMGLMAGLRTLCLEGLSGDVPSCKQVMEAIAHSRQLERIHLFEWTMRDGAPDFGLDKIHLPHLLSLRCKRMPASIQYVIIRRVEAPNCRSLVFDFKGVLHLELLYQVTSSLADRIKSRIAVWNTASIEIDDYNICLSSPSGYTYGTVGEGVEIRLGFREPWGDVPLLAWILTKVPWQADVTIELESEISTQALQYLSGASKLISDGDSFKVIAKPTVSNGRVTWPLHNLTTLDLRREELGVMEFKEFVWDRWGTCDKANIRREDRLGVMERPRSLRTLELPDGLAPKVSKAVNHALGRCGCRE